MATPFSRQLKTFEDLEQELQYFGKSNVSALQKYAVTAPTTPINDDVPAENKDKPFDTTRALSLQPKVEAYENSNFMKRWWLWLATDISNMRTAYYYARATLIFKTLNQQQPLSSTEHQFIMQGVHQHNRFSALGSIYRALNSKTKLGSAIEQNQVKLPNASSINKTLPKSIFSTFLNWLGFNPIKATIELTTADEVTKHPSIAKHGEFKRQFDAYKQSLKKLINDLEASALGSQTLRDTTSLHSQLNDLKKKERGLMFMTHPDKNPGEYQATANANFQRVQSFIDWKTNILETVVKSAENIDPQDRNATDSVMMLLPSFNSLNACDEHQHQEISQLLLDKQKTDEMAEKIKKQYDQLRDDYRIKAEAARKASHKFDDIMRKLDAENAELRKNVQLRKMAASLQTPHKQQDPNVASVNNDANLKQVKPNSTLTADDSTSRPYFNASHKSVLADPISAQESDTASETPTPVS